MPAKQRHFFQVKHGYAVVEWPGTTANPSAVPYAHAAVAAVSEAVVIRAPSQLAQLLLAQQAGGISQAPLSTLGLNLGRFTLERLLLILAALDLELVVRPRRRSEPTAW